MGTQKDKKDSVREGRTRDRKEYKAAIQVLRNPVGVQECQISMKKALGRGKVQRYKHFKGVGGCKVSKKTSIK